jgi:hypothetical protein
LIEHEWIHLTAEQLSAERLGRLPDARTRPGSFGDIPLGVQAELAPTLVEASLGKLVCVDYGRRIDGFLGIGRGGKNVSLIAIHPG